MSDDTPVATEIISLGSLEFKVIADYTDKSFTITAYHDGVYQDRIKVSTLIPDVIYEHINPDVSTPLASRMFVFWIVHLLDHTIQLKWAEASPIHI